MRNAQGSLNHKRWVSLVLLAAMLVSFALPAFAAEKVGTIVNPNGGETANLHQCPGVEYKILAQLPVGSTVEILGQEGNWFCVAAGQCTGYVYKNYVSFKAAQEPKTAVVTLGPINLHDSPASGGRVLAQLQSGAVVTLLGYGDTWCQVNTGNITGYVLTAYLSIGGVPAPVPPVVKPTPIPPLPPLPPVYTVGANATVVSKNGGNVNLRAWADDTSMVLTSFAPGTRVCVLTHGADWCRVQVGNVFGYMATKFLAFDGNGYNVKPVAPKSFTAYVANPVMNQVLNLRQEPSETAKVLGQYANGTKVTVNSVGTLWSRVSVSGVQGYMMTKFLKIADAATPHKTVVNNGSYANVRAGAGYGFDVILRVREGDAATIVIPYPVWSKVIVKNGNGYITGFMMNSFLK